MEEKDAFDTLEKLAVDISINDNKSTVQGAIKKLSQRKELDENEKKCIHELADDAMQVRKISNNAITFSQVIQKRTDLGFLIVLGMYVAAFVVGIVLITFSLYFASKDDNPNEYLAVFFGIAGIGDLAFLLYKPAQKIQESRANASQLLAAFMEWQFVSIWSGKLFGKLYKEFDSCSDKNALFEKMKIILNLKITLTNKLIKAMDDSIEEPKEEKNETIEENSKKYLENDKKNLSKATGITEDKLDYTDFKVIKQQTNFTFGEDNDKETPELFWTAKKTDKEFKEEPIEDEINKQLKSLEEFDKPKHKCSSGTDWDEVKGWKQWSLLKHHKKEKWILRCYNNKQWKCGKKSI